MPSLIDLELRRYSNEALKVAKCINEEIKCEFTYIDYSHDRAEVISCNNASAIKNRSHHRAADAKLWWKSIELCAFGNALFLRNHKAYLQLRSRMPGLGERLHLTILPRNAVARAKTEPQAVTFLGVG
jgi:hypothetical protein